MELLGTVINGTVISLVGLVLWLLIRGRLDQSDRKLKRLEDAVNKLRSDLTMVALAVGVKPEAGTGR